MSDECFSQLWLLPRHRTLAWPCDVHLYQERPLLAATQATDLARTQNRRSSPARCFCSVAQTHQAAVADPAEGAHLVEGQMLAGALEDLVAQHRWVQGRSRSVHRSFCQSTQPP